ncbi:PIG-L deacetylase family protein [Streptomyces sp. SL13]|uniref:PIG-L deacetylase family protein n=1 Tax=Streptantibioticus silvisoli TaxID=2705255 RepID=A0AA90GXP4_9ACTN|nr:PIG-L deacetylase family protein [Streptantibioticus silvisoli]MDI5963969.1 PIG-L deacetylase family protein [Streptantibioticus silvisoli]MDI5970068.1 PIG-L deacetylase family protein [Streptantibioticus silvisoli]
MAALTATGRRVLAVVAHPDDAEIAAGGTLAVLADAGAEVMTLVLAMPEAPPGAHERRAAAEQAAEVLGCTLRWAADGVHRQVSELGEVRAVALIDEVVGEFAPSLVITHWDGDSHADHVVTARAVQAAGRNARYDLYQFRPGEIRTPAFARFRPTAFVDIGAVADRKSAALAPYAKSRPGFRPLDLDAIERVDAMHGAMAGCERAEGFAVARQSGIGGWTG